MAEYANMVTVCCVATLLFLGGWHPLFPAPYSNFVPAVIFALAGLIALYHGFNPARRMDRITLPVTGVVFLGIAAVFLRARSCSRSLIPLFWFAAKVGFLLFVFIWIRATLPRYRYDQLMRLAWTFLFPLAMVNLLITSLLVALFYELDMEAILFFAFAVIRGSQRISLVVQTHPISSALSLIGVMVSLAVCISCWAPSSSRPRSWWSTPGAIMVLFVFVIMLLNAGFGRARAAAAGARI